MAQDTSPWVVVDRIDSDSEPWSGALRPAEGPDRDGGPTLALRWEVAEQPAPNSPALLHHFEDVAGLRFWLWIDGPKDYRLNVLLTGRHEYFNSSVALDWRGWRQLTVPLEQLQPVRGAKLSDMQRISFRMQGYGQPLLDADMVWWVDEIALLPKPGHTLPRTDNLEANRALWESLAAEGNPFALLLARQYASGIGPFSPPAAISSAWQYRGVAQELAGIAWVGCDPASPLTGRGDLVSHLVAGIDWLVSECSEEGWWWRRRPPEGDPNVNRFVLGPLLDAVRFARLRPEGEAAWPRWRGRLDRAIELQKAAYRFELDWDWGGKAGGEYANQDAYYVVIMALSAMLYQRPADQELAAEMVRRIASNLLPDGGIRYIGMENEAPVYHSLNLVVLGRYATLTGDPAAAELLQNTVGYYPLVLSAEGQPEYWSDVWWKQTWGYVWREGLVIAAGATGDARNQWLLWRVLERSTPAARGWDAVCAMPYWTGTKLLEPLPARFVTVDRNARGIRGRDGSWYYGVAVGWGLRPTFCGGMITHPTHTHPLRVAIRGLQINVLQGKDPRMQGLWLSQVNDHAALALRPQAAGGIGARYRLQPRKINGVPTPETPDTPWQVTQVWRAAADGLLGTIVLEAVGPAPGIAVQGRIALGPTEPERLADSEWRAGPLRVRVFESFGAVGVRPVPAYTSPEDWPGIVFEERLADGAEQGRRFVYTVWLGPEGTPPPASVERLPKDAGWVAAWEDGRRAAALFNPHRDAATIEVPWSGQSPHAWQGLDGAAGEPRMERDSACVSLPGRGCALLERR
ncbi:MAG: hypothetical protein JXR77_12020 [Lentisphaeria bacterium]|nr:hypothetical protein [Lentisphaeria bacterium]